jgi:carbamoyltransferase
MNDIVTLSIYEYHNSSASISKGSKILAAFQEDRFAKKKNEVGIPLNSINACLRYLDIKAEDVDYIGIVNDENSIKSKNSILNFLFKRQSRYSVKDWKNENNLFWYKKLIQNKKLDSFYSVMGGKSRIQKDHHFDTNFYEDQKNFQYLKKEFLKRRLKVYEKIGFKKENISFLPHYILHHYHAFYSCINKKFDQSNLIVHCEGDGGLYNHAVSKFSESKGIELLKGTNNFNLGRLYQWTTLNLNMLPYHDEYKVMGLAPYGNASETDDLYKNFKKYFFLNKNKGLIDTKKNLNDLYFSFKDLINNTRFDKVAAILQKFLEDILLELFVHLEKKHKPNSIFYGGGVAMNVKANLHLSKNLKKTKFFFIPLSPADETNVFGGNYYLIEKFFLKKKISLKKIKPLKNIYLGNEYKIKKIHLNKLQKYKVKKYSSKIIGERINSGDVIGRYCARAEFGQRALGNRSILASISYPGIVEKINKKIKSRDFWMPFALSIIDTEFKKYFYNNKSLDPFYMTTCYELKKYIDLKEFQNVVHPADRTGRPQIVTLENNYEYYNLLKAVKKSTGVGAILNTSFNIHKKTIVETIDDAIDVFKSTNLDGIIINDYFISK